MLQLAAKGTVLEGGEEGIKVSKGFAVGGFELFDRFRALLHSLHK